MRPLRAIKEGAASAGSLRSAIVAAILVHTLGTFFYMTIWRNVFAPDFDVNDFKAYYTGALALSEGRPDLLYPDAGTLNLGVLPDQEWVRFAVDRGVPHPSGYIYPPFLAVVIRPLAALPYHRANQAWFVMNSLLFTGAVLLLITWRPGPLDALAAAGILFVCLNFYPTFRAFQCGQVSLLIFSMIAGSFWLLRRGRDGAAGALVGLAAAVKLTPALLAVYFLAARRYRAAAGAAVAGAAALLVSILGAGLDNHFIFAGEILPALSRGAATFANQSLPGFLARIGMETTMNAFQFVDEPRWLWVLARVSSAAVLLGSLILARRLALSGGTEGIAAGFALVVTGSLIASPISWEHHYVQALVPLALLVSTLARRKRVPVWQGLGLAVAYALMAANAYDLIRHHFPYGPGRLAISYALYGGMMVWALLAARSFVSGRTETA
jgi:alpha-1,2-mannosyltransferase